MAIKPQKFDILDPFGDKITGFTSDEIGESRAHRQKIFHIEKRNEDTPKKPKIELMEFQKKRLIVAGAIFCVLASLGIFYGVFRDRIIELFTPTKEQAQTIVLKKRSDVATQARQKGEAFLEETGPFAMIRFFDEQIASGENAEFKAALYATRASLMYQYMTDTGVDFSDEILSDAYSAEEVDPSDLTAYTIYLYESEFGSQDRAEEYRKLALQRGYIISGYTTGEEGIHE